MTTTLRFYSKQKRARPEAALQKAICEHLRLVGTPGMIYFSLPNEGKRSPQAGQELKRMGLRPGAADLCIIVDRQVYFMELKSPKGVQSPEQQAFEDDCKAADITYVVVRSIDLALELLRTWGAIRTSAPARSAHQERISAAMKMHWKKRKALAA